MSFLSSCQKNGICGYCKTTELSINSSHPKLHYVTKVKDSAPLSYQSCRSWDRAIRNVIFCPHYPYRAISACILIFVSEFYVLCVYLCSVRYQPGPAHSAFLNVAKYGSESLISFTAKSIALWCERRWFLSCAFSRHLFASKSRMPTWQSAPSCFV